MIILQFYLGQELLMEFARLHKLETLRMDNVQYRKDFFHAHNHRHSPLSSVKQLSLIRFHNLDFNVETDERIPFDGKHFCETLAIWFPSLEKFAINSDEDVLQAIEPHLNLLPGTSKILQTNEARERELDQYSGRHNIRVENYQELI